MNAIYVNVWLPSNGVEFPHQASVVTSNNKVTEWTTCVIALGWQVSQNHRVNIFRNQSLIHLVTRCSHESKLSDE